MNKVQLILESPTEREKYKNLESSDDKLSFLSNHFIMDDMTVRLIKRRYLLSEKYREELVQSIEDVIRKIER
ncbi:hypothetical protein C900_05275 [Fulvivirga imtechensis AK7]|uniref:Uncharacterized protein n=2 Tax=Fulvivirga TaxID=396811 RepID=L8JW10_9BACT|nr:hypothetical protein C900_05275 [Fulvivirga imtechensis AK7]